MKFSEFLGLVVIGVVATPSASALAKKVQRSETHSLHIPDEVAPAINPYLFCRLQSLGANISGEDGKPVETLASKAGDCSVLRVKAAADADVLLTKTGKDEASRSAAINATLKSVDDFADEMRSAMAAPKGK